MELRRVLTGATLAVLTVAGLSACQSKVGLAASAAGNQLTDSQLSAYVQPGAKAYTTQSSGTTVTPKLYALENWVDAKLFAASVVENGGAGTRQEISRARAAVLGTRTAADYTKYYGSLGYTPALSALLLEQSTMLVLLVERLGHVSPSGAISALQGGQASSALLKAVNRHHPAVAISPRYGTWDPRSLALATRANAGVPAFVHGATSAAQGS